MPFYAHSATDAAGNPDLDRFQLLAAHLRGVAAGAEHRATSTQLPGLPAAARLAGLLHDLGKYRSEFQAYILQPRGTPGGPLTRHKEAGAAKALDAQHIPVVYAILGHHGGVPDKTGVEAAVKGSNGRPIAAAVWTAAAADCPDLAAPLPAPPAVGKGFRADLFTRLLFSCLVDADWADTGEHERQVRGWENDPEPPPLAPAERWGRLETHLAGLADRPLEPRVKAARDAVLKACLAKSQEPPGLYSLTVPTGGGKTLAALAFALRHAAAHGLRRVIYVAPYMTILEQNADVIREALGLGPSDPAVFAHYSLAEPPGDGDPDVTAAAARRAENWDAPVVVTTNVQFFESLFSNKPGRCRKLHNVAGSVVILDECQTLPPGLVAPTCGMLKQLAAPAAAGGLGCSVVLCTATQPAFDHGLLNDDERLEAKEIIPSDADLFTTLKRVKVVWPKPFDAPLAWAEVADRMADQPADRPAALCVVNTKKAARAVYGELAKRGLPGVFHLSTGMCPQHRREKLKQVRGLLDAKAPCYVVSTQLIEAGVDVDFPFLMREMAPLESVVQAAGRCNREGRLTDAGGRVEVFRSADGGIPRGWYVAGRDVLEGIIKAKGDGPQIDDPAAIKDYFGRLYYSGKLDKENIRELRQTFKFESTAAAYRLIDDAGVPVVVATWEAHEEEIHGLLVELAARPRKATYRKLAAFQVNLLPSQLLNARHLMHEVPGGLWVWDGKYDADAGIVHEMLDDVLIG